MRERERLAEGVLTHTHTYGFIYCDFSIDPRKVKE